MTEVKQVLSHLCKVFKGLFSEIIKPEYFRYSKFDKTSEEVVPVLWRLLHNLCCSSTFQKNKNCDFEDIITCVKLTFASMRYNCVAFYNLPANMDCGSRELLLALGWFLSTDRFQKVVQKFVAKSLLQHEYPPYSGEDLAAFESVDLKSEDEIINYINWISGRVKTNITYISNLTRELISLTSRVHAATECAFGVAGGHLSVQEVLLLKDHSLITERLLEDCRLTVALLENYLLWTKNQNVFWTWMESVIKEEVREKASNNNYCKKELDRFIQILKAEIRKQALKDDEQECNLLPSIMVDDKIRVLHGKCNDTSTLDTLIKDIDKQLQRLKFVQKTKFNQINKSCQLMADEAVRQDDYSSRKYFAGGVCRCDTDLSGKTVIVTGGNSGIGKSTAAILASRGAVVIIACRNPSVGREALEDIKNISRSINNIYALINNAGVFYCPFQVTVDGYEVTFQTNYLGPFLLTNQLLKAGLLSAGSRVVNVSSEAHRYVTDSNVIVHDVQRAADVSRDLDQLIRYGQSKLCLNLLTLHLATLYKDILWFSVNPGNVDTQVLRNFPLTKTVFWTLLAVVRPLLVKTPSEGAQTSVHAVLYKDCAKLSGSYLSDCKPAAPSELSLNKELAEKLYRATLEWCNS
ncbi:hypothetical protein LSTR_LSTR009062 [Laodelphax striatellus]|uniref:Tubulin epsilon and delta complex protein 1 domain-containing protein n=1 Tax=Laodelphax striatellus TaxID=195883 RepID=A0A482XP63_LAOST|nr:hypothetical protein LSTR_LSTR009062 [Laodelphax striatellus]